MFSQSLGLKTGRSHSFEAPDGLLAIAASTVSCGLPSRQTRKSDRGWSKLTSNAISFNAACKYSSQKLELNVVCNSIKNFPSRSRNPSDHAVRTAFASGE